MTARPGVGASATNLPTEAPATSNTLTGVTFGVSSVQGQSRMVNQDYAHTRPLAQGAFQGALLALVADGLGAYSASAEASALACQTVADDLAGQPDGQSGWQRRRDPRDPRGALLAATQSANLALWRAAQARDETLKTTLTALLLSPTMDGQSAQIALAHVGDSRAYLARGGRLHLLTRDHTVARDLRALTRLVAPLGRRFGREWAPPRHILSRVMGANPIVRIDSLARATQPGDQFIICSDGVWGSLDEAAFAALARGEADPQTLAERLIAEAQEAGSPDDASAVVVALAGAQ